MNPPLTLPPEQPSSSSTLAIDTQVPAANGCPFNAPCIEVKLTRLEKPAEAEPKKRDGWEIMQGLASILSPLMIFFFGYALTSRVDTAVKTQQLHTENVRQMQQVLTDLLDPAVTREKAHASAVVLAAYGGETVPLLLHVLEEDTQYAGDAAEEGLLAVSKQDVPAVCTGLGEILSKQTKLYSFSAHRRVLRVMKNLECRDQLLVLQEYQKRLEVGSPFPFRGIAGQDSTVENANDVNKELVSTLQVLASVSK